MNNIALDEKYVSLLSNQLLRFKITRRNPFQVNFRCPYCGDSKKDLRKARGYVYEKNSNLWFSCRNCSKSTNVPALIKHVDQRLHTEYVKEKYQNEPSVKVPLQTKIEVTEIVNDIALLSIDKLDPSHTAYKFLEKRLIPKKNWKKLFYTDKFFTFSNSLEPGKFSKAVLKHDEARIVIPFYDKHHKLITIQGRALGDSKAKYITIKIDKTQPHIFGGDTVNHSKRIYIVEGPFDSMFLPNAMAAAQSDLASAMIEYGADPSEDYVLVFDNEPRNKDICRLMKKAIVDGWKICIWPLIFAKDINEMVLSGITASTVQHDIDERTFKDLRATLELGRWSKKWQD